MARRPVQALLLGLAGAVAASALWLPGALDRFENATWTWRVRHGWKPKASTSKIKVILIDQASLDWAAKENDLTWPWMRQAYVPILDFCRTSGARVVAFDMLYSETSRDDVADDQAFGAAIAARKDFVSAVFIGAQAKQQTNWPAAYPRPAWKLEGDYSHLPVVEPGAAFPVPSVGTNAAMLANVKDVPDDDGVFRRVTPFRVFDGQPLPSLGLATWLTTVREFERKAVLQPGQLLAGAPIPLDDKGRVLLRFRGPSGTHESLSAAAVIQSALRLQEGGKPVIDPAELKDCYVFFGVSAPALKDLKPTPAAGDYPGVELHATFLDNLLEGDFLRDLPRAVSLLGVLLLSIGAAFTVLVSRTTLQTSLALGGFLLASPALGFGLYDRGFWWPMVYTWVAVAFAQTGAVLWNYATEGRQKRFIKSAFQQYLSGDVIEQMLADPKRLQLGGEKRELTMFFSDLKGFSTISESLEPAELTSLMNDVLSDVCEVIFEEGGTVDKFIGDAVVAFWNAPVPQADHAARAVRAAIRCQRRLAEKSEAYRARARGIPIHMRIGLNTGDVVVGNMGSRQRFNYTMLGDAANLASRLEGANKAFGTTIMVGETTWKQLGGSVPGREIAAVRVVGRATPVRVFEPLGLPGETVPAKFEHYARALELVRQKQWRLAADHFQDIPNDPLAAKYAERCMALRDGQLADWDGVWNLTEK